MESVYRSEFKRRPGNGAKLTEDYQENCEYRRQRRLHDAAHEPYFFEQPPVHSTRKPLADITAYSLAETSTPVKDVPALQLRGRLSPSPPPLRRQLHFVDGQADAAVQTTSRAPPVRAAATQTPVGRSRLRSLAAARRRVRPSASSGEQGQTRTPFALYGSGNDAPLMAAHRTFNVNAAKQVYASALRVARRSRGASFGRRGGGGVPLPSTQRKRSAVAVDAASTGGKRARPNVDVLPEVVAPAPLSEYRRQFVGSSALASGRRVKPKALDLLPQP